MKTCNKCQGTFSWKMPYDGTKLAAGDNPCSCGGHTESKPSTAPRVEVPIEQIVAEIVAIKGTMAKISNDIQADRLDEPDMTPEMVEGIWKFAISRKMGGRN